MSEDHVERASPSTGAAGPGAASAPGVSGASGAEAPAPAGPVERTATAAEPGAIEPVALDTWHPLSPRYVKFQRIVSSVVLLIVFPPLVFVPAIVGVFTSIWWLATLIPFGVLILALGSFWLAWIYPALHHRHAAYRVDERQIEWRHGVWWRRVTVIPCSRVQHTDVSQGPFERRFGLGTLHVHTAGTEHSQVSITGLEHARASWIRDHLVKGIGGDAV